MATMLYRKQRKDWFRRFNDDNFDLSDKKRENRSRKVENCQLQTLLDEDDIQSQKMLAEQLGVSQVAISIYIYIFTAKPNYLTTVVPRLTNRPYKDWLRSGLP